MYLDFKISAWERVYIPKELEQEVLTGLKNGTILTSSDVICAFEEKGVEYDGMICLESLVPNDNDGHPTIEFIEDEGGDIIFRNA